MLNKTIWLLWLQGWDSAPWLVKQVAESWKINNSDWNIEYVTLENLQTYVDDIDYIYDKTKKIRPQHKADIIRLSLLKNYGGVWADATMLCMQPLGVWVEEAVKPAGLWMYHGHGCGMSGKNGPAIWFIVSEKDSLMINKWKNACDEYWKNRTATNSYLWLDELFRKLFKSDIDFRNKWNLAPHLYCELKGQAHTLARHKRMVSSERNLKKILREKPPYALKLWWKDWQGNFPDVNSFECKNSNGYYALQMSKRKFTFKHKMDSKNSVVFLAKMFVFDVKYFSEQKIKVFVKTYIKKLYPKF
ncbi:capsular polysaccharide synthesis protein [Myxosarcina sp. GI1]|uniref:capsular polysaccharide synthesis protein n=1 Tax=Myxosarcina sp. GI1 TaxID=1541065 RepID=UPI00055D8493|nr:capsular polysaccharide synthesis protein [Myxosarcina sp. GI1]